MLTVLGLFYDTFSVVLYMPLAYAYDFSVYASVYVFCPYYLSNKSVLLIVLYFNINKYKRQESDNFTNFTPLRSTKE